MQRTLVAKARHEAVARGITPQEIVGILEGVATILRIALHVVSKEQGHGLAAAELGQTAPTKVFGLIAVGRLKGGLLDTLDSVVAVVIQLVVHVAA